MGQEFGQASAGCGSVLLGVDCSASPGCGQLLAGLEVPRRLSGRVCSSMLLPAVSLSVCLPPSTWLAWAFSQLSGLVLVGLLTW